MCAVFFGEIVIFLHCFALCHTFPHISTSFNWNDSFFLSLSQSLTLLYLQSSLIHRCRTLVTHRQICQKKNQGCGDTKSCIFCIRFYFSKKKVWVSSLCPSACSQDFSLCFYDCAPMAVSPYHHGNLLSLLLATHIVCVLSAVQPLPDTFTLSLHHRSVLSVCVFCVQWACLKSSLSVGPWDPYCVSYSQTHTLMHTVRSELLLTEAFEVWHEN